jgi:HK97 family phage prohead protease
MPLPKPKKDEDKNDFIERCMSSDVMGKEYPKNDQRLAVCNTLWKDRNMERERETRHLKPDQIELRVLDTDEGSKIVGYPIRFNVWSEDLGGFRERIRPDAVKNALLRSDIRMLYDHSTNHIPLGRTPKTLNFAPDTKGVKIENELPDTQLAHDLKVSINRGDIDGMSFGMIVAENGDEWREKDGIVSRTITEIEELFDFSVVVYPAYTATKVAVRALDKAKELNSIAINGGMGGITPADEQRNLEIDILTITTNDGGFER